jgi:predicted ATP-grasp superfamily ATP-dependent carboligase
MEKIRDPFWLRDFLQSASLPTIDLKTHDAPPDNAEKWLIKPFRSGHGLQIRNGLGAPAQHDEYYQELKRGLSVGAMFLADGQHCQLIGCHQQLRALQLDSSQPYQFCGAVAPLPLPDDTVNTISNIGELLTQETSLRGLFGCDFIVSENTPYLLEVNPRYTAATELWETLLNRSLIADHITACQQGLLSTIPTYHFSGIRLAVVSPSSLSEGQAQILPTGMLPMPIPWCPACVSTCIVTSMEKDRSTMRPPNFRGARNGIGSKVSCTSVMRMSVSRDIFLSD